MLYITFLFFNQISNGKLCILRIKVELVKITDLLYEFLLIMDMLMFFQLIRADPDVNIDVHTDFFST